MVNIKIILDTRKQKKDGTYPICFRIYHCGKSTIRSVKIYITTDQWDDEKRIIRSNHPNASTLNRRLLKEFADLQSELLLADDEKVTQYFNPIPVVRVAEKKAKPTIYMFADELIADLRIDNKIGNAWVYEATINALKRFHSNEDLHFEHIDFKFLDNYNKHLLRSGVKHNTAFLYIRTPMSFEQSYTPEKRYSTAPK